MGVSPAWNRADGLSPRQVKIVGLIADGLTIKQIAGRFHISKKTAEWHRKRICEMLKISNPAQLVKLGVAFGLSKL